MVLFLYGEAEFSAEATDNPVHTQFYVVERAAEGLKGLSSTYAVMYDVHVPWIRQPC